MQTANLPRTGRRYWTALSIASIAGANLGDFCAHDLHLGHWHGLAPFALLFAIVVTAERRTGGGEVCYWLAILIVRTAATNVADLGTHDLRLSDAAVITGLAVLLVATLVVGRSAASATRRDLPSTDARYWLAMLLAGTLGTALGDDVAGVIGLPSACALLGLLLAGLFVLRPSYWALVVAIRTVGTNWGDLFAHSLGLAASTALTVAALLATLLIWQRAARSADP